MKKICLLLICLFTFCLVNVDAFELPTNTGKDKVNIYMFRGSGCSHCYEALEHFYEAVTDNPKLLDYINFEIYETWYDSDNADLFNYAALEMGDEAGGVPYFVVGESYHQAGFLTSIGDEIIQTALNEYSNASYTDVVKRVIDEYNLNNINPETLEDACKAEGIIDDVPNHGKGAIGIEPAVTDTDDGDNLIFNADEEGFFALGVMTMLLIISVIVNAVTLPLSLIFIILYCKEKKKNKKTN